MSGPDYARGWNAALEAAAAIADKWRDENRVSAAKASRRGRWRHDIDGDETMLVMAEQLDGAAAECAAIRHAIRELAKVEASHEA